MPLKRSITAVTCGSICRAVSAGIIRFPVCGSIVHVFHVSGTAFLCFPSTFVRIVYFQRQTSGISSIISRAIVAYSSCLFEFLICIANLVFLPMTSQTFTAVIWVRFPYGSPKKKSSIRMASFFAIRMPEPSHRFSHRPFLTYDSAKSLRQTAVNSLPVLPHCTKFCRRKSRRVEQENAGWNSRKRCAIICPQAKTACNMMKKKEGLFP